MDDMDDDQLGVIKAHCRCGSRLPWNQCHAARLEMYHSVHRKNKNPARDNLAYIVSPLAKCPCRKTKKTYYTCCWKDISTVYLLTDDNGAIWPFEACAPEFVMKDLSDMSSEDYDLYVGQIWPDFIAMMCSPSSCDEKSKLSTWDPDVYTGCLGRLKKWFNWTDIHWRIEKDELMLRVKEWNEALVKYCDDKGYAGDVRQTIIDKYTASPLAPCGNRSCDKYETAVKSFYLCSACKKIAYCCRLCQKEDWKKRHKHKCGNMDVLLFG